MSLADWKKRYLAQHNEGSEFSNRSSKNESRTAPRKAMRRQYRKVDGLPDAKYGATAGTLNRDYGQNFDPPPSHFGSAESDSGPGFSSQQSIDSNSNGANCNELAVEYDPDDELTLAEVGEFVVVVAAAALLRLLPRFGPPSAPPLLLLRKICTL